jgi:intracellular multiplication protein IcmL
MAGKTRYGAAEAARLRHETFATGFRRMTFVALAMSGVAVVATGAAVWALAQKPNPLYFAAREDGGIVPLVPTEEPYLHNGQVTNFAVEAITRAFTLDFANWRRDMSETSEYFERPDGWNNFLEAMEASGVLDFIRNRRLVATAVANGATIVSSGPDELGRFAWIVQVPLTVTYESSSQTTRDNLLAEIQITRLPTWQTSRAVGITRVIMKAGRSQ